MRRLPIAVCLLLLPSAAVRADGLQAGADFFAPFASCASVPAGERRRIDAGATFVSTLPEQDGHVGIFGVRRLDAGGDRLVAWVRAIDQLKQSPLVDAIGRFSDPPRLADLDALHLEDADLQAIRSCRPSRCDIKLTASEIARLQREIADAGTAWQARLQAAFREVVLDRLRAYLAGGLAALDPYADGRSPLPPAAVFAELLGRSPCLRDALPDLAAALAGPPRSDTGLESFFYWSRERIRGRPVVSVTHVVVARPRAAGEDAAMVAGKQLFATHYLNGYLNLTAVVGGGASSPHYLVVLNRTNVDVIRGLFGGLTRAIVERRLRGEVSDLLEQLSRRLAGGPPRQTVP